MPERTVPEYLQQFDEPSGYLDFARFGPVSAQVRDALVGSASAIHHRGWDALADLDAATGECARTAAGLLGCAPHEIAFVGSTSHGMFAAAHAFGAHTPTAHTPTGRPSRAPGTTAPGTVLASRADFPGALYPWLRAAGNGGLAVRLMDGPVTADAVRAHLDEGVRAVSVCAVDAATGFRAPLAAIKEVIGPQRVLVVDAVQALGAVDLEADAADVLASGGQKWLRAGWGAALLLVRDRVADRLDPGLGGWSGVLDPIEAPDHPRPARPGAVAHTLTNPDGPAVAALGAGLALVRNTGIERIAALIDGALDALLDAARAVGARTPGATGSGIARFRLPGADPQAVHDALTRAGLATTLRGGWIRLSPHASTDPKTAAARLSEALHAARAA
ncbi:aminotransferase class V-fold PLP-dependent enzyme [Kitasatospora sp. NPDC058170]|uniref:aminotransferase class V-fold PLP-dependent enzyme n=1 Tax=Kitasatospora sp. NPDC058170 TaxID=3346364 RepID=UPI0036DA9E4C